MLRAIAVCVALLGQTPSSQPADQTSTRVDARFRALVDEGLEAYEAGSFDEAASRFLEAYDLIPEPELIYNAGRSFEKGLQREAAIERYEQFLTLEGTTARLRSRALDSLKLLRRELEALREPAPTAEPPERAPPAATTRPPALPRGPNRALEITLLSSGGVALVAGGVFGILALQSRSDFDDAEGSERVGLRDEVERNALVADVLLASGAALTATGIVLFFVRKGPRDARRAAWAPAVGPNTVGVTGRF